MMRTISLRFLVIFTCCMPCWLFAAEESTPPSAQVYRLGLSTHGGMMFIGNDRDLQDTASGWAVGLGLGGALRYQRVDLGLGLGWTYSRIPVRASAGFLSEYPEFRDSPPSHLDTSFAEFSLRAGYYVLPYLVAGARVMLPFGTDTRFSIRSDEQDSLPQPFFGLQLRFSPPRQGSSPLLPQWWYGVEIGRDLSIDDRSVYHLRASIDFDLPVYAPETPVRVRYETRYRLRERVVNNIKDTHFITLGLIDFSKNAATIAAKDVKYLTALARFLAGNPTAWDQLLIGTPPRRGGGGTSRELMKNRLRFIGAVLSKAGISHTRIKTYPLSEDQAIQPSPDSFDFSLVSAKSLDPIKNSLVQLMQRYEIPDTCPAKGCK